MSRPSYYLKPIVNSMQILNAFCSAVEPYLPLALTGTRITETDVWYVLGYASVQGSSIEAACTDLHGAASGNRVREVLRAALPAPAVLQGQLNRALHAQLPRVLLKGKRSYSLALDCTLIPYHGQVQPNDTQVLRAQAKSGTHHFHGYATVSIVHDRKRYVLALRLVRPGETMVAIVRDLLTRVRRWGIRIRRVYLDKEFYSIDVFRTLDRRGLAYILPLPLRGTLQRLCHGRHSIWTDYTLTNSRSKRSYTISIVLVRRHQLSTHRHHVAPWLGYAVRGLPPGTRPRHVFQLYRQRFGIETCYRQMHQVRARTSSRNPHLRLLLVGLALLLVNLYVTLRYALRTSPGARCAGRSKWFTLARLAHQLSHAIETHWRLTPVEQLQSVWSFS